MFSSKLDDCIKSVLIPPGAAQVRHRPQHDCTDARDTMPTPA